MPALANADDLLELVRKSGVTDDGRVKGYVQGLRDRHELPPDAPGLAAAMVRDGLLSNFQAEQLLQGKWKRFFVGKYKVLERIGVGGMGQVFLCEHKLMRRRVAVKVLPVAKGADPAARERFYREARAVAALDHPNIVRAYDVDQDDNLHFLVMEFVDGTNLHDLVKKFGPLDPVRAAHYVYAAAVGLQHAHEMGLVHRDVKPGNLLLDRAGVIKVLDLGLARFFHDDDDQLTKKYDESILGTADYLAPEQALDSTAVDIRADLYSLGGTFYFLLTGRAPFPDGSVAQKLLWHQSRDPVPVDHLRPELPPGLAAVVARMMAKKPDDRYQTPAEVAAALAPWVQTPIAPPDLREMPLLSAAAAAAGGGPQTTRYAGGSSTLLPGPQTATVSSSGGMRTLTAAVAVPPPAPTSPSAPTGPWDELTADTRTDTRTDTGPAPPRRPPKAPPAARPAPSAPLRSRRPLVFAAVGGAVLLLGLVGGTAAVLLTRGKSAPVARTAGEPKTWYVSKAAGPDPDRTLATLRGAFEQAGADDTVVLLDDHLDEPPVVLADPAGKKKGVRIVAGNASKQVAWAPRGARAAALEIDVVENLRVSGLVIDLGGQIDTGIAVVRGGPGLVIENVTVRGPKGTGFRLVSVAGDPGRPVQLHRCRVVADERIDAAVLFAGGNRFVSVTANRFEGPGGAAVRVDGAAQEVEVRNNRVFNFDTGVLLAGPLPRDATFALTVANNTFHTIQTAAVATDHPLGGKQQLALSRNYFAATKAIATSPAAVPGLKAADNAHDAATKEGTVPTGSTAVNVSFPPPDPANDGAFLRPAGGKSVTVGPDRVPVGAQPE